MRNGDRGYQVWRELRESFLWQLVQGCTGRSLGISSGEVYPMVELAWSITRPCSPDSPEPGARDELESQLWFGEFGKSAAE